ncbi:hypothetical protein BC831DRAFT_442900 [Entophlyctis helioformis]|nr:hypothetical protein BC831DRAFT_442900 [Entophlyctis helioformis]
MLGLGAGGGILGINHLHACAARPEGRRCIRRVHAGRARRSLPGSSRRGASAARCLNEVPVNLSRSVMGRWAACTNRNRVEAWLVTSNETAQACLHKRFQLGECLHQLDQRAMMLVQPCLIALVTIISGCTLGQPSHQEMNRKQDSKIDRQAQNHIPRFWFAVRLIVVLGLLTNMLHKAIIG